MQNYFYRLSALLMTAVFLTLSGGCAVQEQPRKLTQIKIGVTRYKQDDTFISTVCDQLEYEAKAREGAEHVKITLNILDGKGNQSIQNDQVDKFLSQAYDVICVNEVDRTAASVIIDKAKSARIPVVFFNREPVEEDMQRWDKLYYVGSNPREAGTMQGQIIVDAYEADPAAFDRSGDGKLQYVMLEGEPGHQDAAIRTEFSIKTLIGAHIQVEKLANDTANWQRAQASAKMAQWIETYGDTVEVVFANNDDMALGAFDAYAAAELKAPPIVGIDGTPLALDAVKSGALCGTVKNDGAGQAKAIFDIAYALATGADVAAAVPQLEGQYVWMPHHTITKENVEEEIHK